MLESLGSVNAGAVFVARVERTLVVLFYSLSSGLLPEVNEQRWLRFAYGTLKRCLLGLLSRSFLRSCFELVLFTFLGVLGSLGSFDLFCRNRVSKVDFYDRC